MFELDLGERAALVDSGCRPEGKRGEVLGEQVMLNYSTVVARYDMWKARLTLWLAPELSCFAEHARTTAEKQITKHRPACLIDAHNLAPVLCR
jgi:hypothetical protein